MSLRKKTLLLVLALSMVLGLLLLPAPEAGLAGLGLLVLVQSLLWGGYLLGWRLLGPRHRDQHDHQPH